MCVGFVYVCKRKSFNTMEYSNSESNGTKSTVAFVMRVNKHHVLNKFLKNVVGNTFYLKSFVFNLILFFFSN